MNSSTYKPAEIEPKWQKWWEENHIYAARDSLGPVIPGPDPGSSNSRQKLDVRSEKERSQGLLPIRDELLENKNPTSNPQHLNPASNFQPANFQKPKYYLLFEFPYPSGDRLHVGHGRSYSALDALARKKRMQGYNVLLPMGWDAFGLPAENYAIKMKTTPQAVVPQNIAAAKKQVQSWGLSIDWSREINTTDPAYYRWTQWIFLKMYEKGLAYCAELPINWCPKCQIGLANEEVVSGNCERCGTATERRNVTQWVLKITDYADRLIDDLDLVDFSPKIRAQQINWIGRSIGTEISFNVCHPNSSELTPNYPNKNGSDNSEKFGSIRIFTTRADTIYGVTALVVSPEHPLASVILNPVKDPDLDSSRGAQNDVASYVAAAKRKSELERTDLSKEKTGVFTGLFAANPITGEKVPVWVGDYVIGTYGGGAVMVVPAHDSRDYEFAKKYDLPIKTVIDKPEKSAKSDSQNISVSDKSDSPDFRHSDSSDSSDLSTAYTDYGILVNSGPYTGLKSADAIKRITSDLEKLGLGSAAKHYHLRDWIFSRQHYWGEPIPLIHCDKCGVVPVPEKDLPITLPKLEHYEPTGNTQSPLAAVTEWVNVPCPNCGGPAKRDTDTMPNWAGSNWYYVAYLISTDFKADLHGSSVPNICENQSPIRENPVDIFSQNRELLNYWLPVDLYNGGMEHTTLHLLYSRFVYKFLFDLGVVPGPEPYAKRRSHGMVLSYDGEKMSKSRGNVVNPDDIVKEFGADTFRMYEMFMGPFGEAIAWNQQGVVGVNKFLHRVWKLVIPGPDLGSSHPQIEVLLNNLVRKVSGDLSEDALKFNTAVAAFMTFINAVGNTTLSLSQKETLLRLLSPFAPHLTEELWHQLGHSDTIHLQPWPEYNPNIISNALTTIVIQVNGKVRGQLQASAETAKNEVLVSDLARQVPKVQEYIAGKAIIKLVFVPGKLINFVF